MSDRRNIEVKLPHGPPPTGGSGIRKAEDSLPFGDRPASSLTIRDAIAIDVLKLLFDGRVYDRNATSEEAAGMTKAEWLARQSYLMADAMIVERSRKSEQNGL